MSEKASNWRDHLEQLRSSRLFETLVISIIIVAALLIGMKTFEQTSRFERIMYWLDWGIILFFLAEIIIRIAAEKQILHFFKKGWNIFDFVIITASLLPVENAELVFVARLLRIFRVLRLVSIIPELRILLETLVKSLPRTSYVALLMLIIFYIYGAVGTFLFQDVDEKLWENIALAMLTLFQVATFESWATAVLYPTMEHYPYSWIYFLTFIFFNAFIFLNMMIGIVLDVMQKQSAKHELETGEGEAADVHWLRKHVAQQQAQLNRIEALLNSKAEQKIRKTMNE